MMRNNNVLSGICCIYARAYARARPFETLLTYADFRAGYNAIRRQAKDLRQAIKCSFVFAMSVRLPFHSSQAPTSCSLFLLLCNCSLFFVLPSSCNYSLLRVMPKKTKQKIKQSKSKLNKPPRQVKAKTFSEF